MKQRARMSLLSINAIDKAFFSTQALKDVSFSVETGEVVGLLGANGAGKSTLLKIIGGTLNTDAGSIFLDGKEITQGTPQKALQLGIVSVYQELNLFSHRTVAENLFMGREIKSRFGTIDWNETNRQAQLILDEHELDIKAEALVSSLSVAKQHMVEIARAFNEKPKLLLLDEPTSALAETEIEWLFRKIQEAAGRGVTVLYVSHRLDEVTRICQRNVILRDGRLVHVSSEPMEKAAVIRHIVGHDVVLDKVFTEKNTAAIVLEARNVKSRNDDTGGNFFVRQGEILGVAGLVGSGRTELLHALFGINQTVFQPGEIHKDGRAIRIDTPADAIRSGIILVPEDRKLSGLFLPESARFNIAAATLDRRVTAGLVDTREEIDAAAASAKRVMLDPHRLEHLVRQLSGGNQQKVVLAKTLLANADVLLLDEPTRGVDIGAREEIYEIIRQLAESGKSILLVTSDWEELIYLSHRVIVLSDQKIVGEIEDGITEEAILHVAEARQEPKARHRLEAKRLKQLYSRVLGKSDSNFMLLVIILLAGLVLGAAINPFFRTWLNFSNLFGQSMPLIILSLGQLIVIIAGGIDISSGALMAASSVIGLSLMNELGFPPWGGVAVIILFGVLVGFINAFLIQTARVDPFVVTIGMMLILEGIALIVTPRPIGPSPEIFKALFNRDVSGIPSALILLVVLLAVFNFLLRYTPLGRRFYAIGENKVYSFNAGFNVSRVTYLAYIFCSLMSVLAAIYILGRFGAADPVLGVGMELQAIACVLIGGATLAGGRGSIAGTVAGVFVLGVLANLLSLMDINVWYQEVITGVMLLVIIASYEKIVRQKEIVL